MIRRPRPTPPTSAVRRPELDGLRGIAIALVLLYHAGSLAGGYVGVDLFFVVSGFLISGLLLRELDERGSIDLLGFYARRARRILPTATVVLLGVALTAIVALPVTRLVPIGEELVGAGSFTANLLFEAREVDYFRGWIFLSPLLHTWSLAIEEQFYLLWPLLFALAWRLGRGRLALVLAVAVAFSLSLGLSLSLGAGGFFSLPARLFELAAGGLAALALGRIERLPVQVRRFASGAGLVLVAIALARFDQTTLFPGVAALLPVAGAFLVIVGGGYGVGRLLSLRAIGALGRRSYPIYLVHYPIFLLLFDGLVGENTLLEQASMIGLALLVAEPLHRFVEEPFRRSVVLAARPARTLLLGLGAIALTIGAGLALPAGAGRIGSGIAAPASIDALPSAHLTELVPENLRPTLVDASWRELDTTLAWGCFNVDPIVIDERCIAGDRDGSRTVLVVGDSHSINWSGALDAYGKTADLRVVGIGRQACPAIDYELDADDRNASRAGCETMRAAALAWAERERPDLVLLLTSQAFYGIAERPERIERFGAATEATVGRYRALGLRVATLGASPSVGRQIPDCLARNLTDARRCTIERTAARSDEVARLERAASERAGGEHLDLFDLTCPAERCPVIVGDLLLYSFGDHLTKRFSVFIAPAFGARVEALLALPAGAGGD